MLSLDAQENYLNRELSWLQFNARVLAEAGNEDNPLLERAKFLAIVSSNLDEYFMVRVASVRDQQQAGYDKEDASGYTPRQQLRAISAQAHEMVRLQYRIYKDITQKLRKNGVRVVAPAELSGAQRAQLEDYFKKNIYPVLTPMAVDHGRHFPLVYNKSLNLAVLVEREEGDLSLATLQVPSALARLVQVEGAAGHFILVEDVIRMHLHELFPGAVVQACFAYRVTRNADLGIEEEEADDLLREIERSLHARKWGAVIRLEVEEFYDRSMLKQLQNAFEIGDAETYVLQGPINPDFLMRTLYKLDGLDALRYPPYAQRVYPELSGQSIFDVIAKGDVLLHHPYDSFEPVVRFLQEAAEDPKVLAIKQTLYRVSGDSPIVKALKTAVENGKQVTVLLEVKARFDEENNIQWGKLLEQAGCHVLYGIAGLKTHSKITLVVRSEAEGIRRYVHLGTGNYNDVTAGIYTDFGLLSVREAFGEDATEFFNMLTGYGKKAKMKELVAAPHDLRDAFEELIEKQIQLAKDGKKAEIFAKMNSLVDNKIIYALYRASEAGVKIKLIVRGICCLRPGVKGVSENIKVRSIVGRYLEHSRVFCFGTEGAPQIYLSSADWMPRNLNRRVELLFPVLDPAICVRVLASMKACWKDNVKAWRMLPDGTYERVEKTGETPFSVQDMLQDHQPEELLGLYL